MHKYHKRTWKIGVGVMLWEGHMSAVEPMLCEELDRMTVHTLNMPERLNAFNKDMHISLRSMLSTAIENVNCRAIPLTGAGRAFCAGQDLGARDMCGGGEAPDLGNTLEVRAKALAFTGEPLDARTAADWGMTWKTLPDDCLMQLAPELWPTPASCPLFRELTNKRNQGRVP